MKPDHFSISTAIDYPSGKPHLGHLYEKVTADCIARWHRLLGEQVHFSTGTDEHGSKIQKRASAEGVSPQEYVNNMSEHFRALCKAANISFDDFIRTTEVRHEIAARHLLQIIYDKGDIYKGTYEGLYCVECETFYLEKNLVNNCCPVHEKPVEQIAEETYFFRMSAYQEKVKHYIQTHPHCVQPTHKRQEILARLQEPVHDLSISRATVSWGFHCPWDESHTIYIWGDALTNYLTTLGYPAKKYETYWPMLHIIGKDILWHHTMIWFSLLLAADVPLPTVFSHGFVLTTSGEKMSKSKGISVDPMDILQMYGTDPVRYYLLKEIPFGQDGMFSHAGLVARLNNELADQLGNLLNRFLVLADKFSSCKIHVTEIDTALAQAVPLHAVKEHMAKFELHLALQAVMSFVQALNKYIDSHKPWQLAKENPERVGYVLYNVREGLRCVAILLIAFLPATTQKITDALGVPLGKIADCSFGFSESKVHKGALLFTKFEEEPVADQNPTKGMTYVKLADFSKLDLRVGTICGVQDHPNAEKLYILLIDFEKKPQRQIVAGLRKHYTKDQLLGKQVIVVCNLEPVVLRGVESAGMLLAAESPDGKQVVVLTPDTPVANDSIIR